MSQYCLIYISDAINQTDQTKSFLIIWAGLPHTSCTVDINSCITLVINERVVYPERKSRYISCIICIITRLHLNIDAE